jgi:hypothetical protein
VEKDFLLYSIIALAVVFLVLSVLSLLISLLTRIFPAKSEGEDTAALIAAVTSHYNRIYPQSRITKIEEQK